MFASYPLEYNRILCWVKKKIMILLYSLRMSELCVKRNGMVRFFDGLGWVVLLAVWLGGCSGVRHTGEAYVLVGQAYPVAVDVKLKEGESASGEVFYRLAGEPGYRRQPLASRVGGRQLWASLPVDLSVVGQTIEYYLDIVKGGKPYAFYSPVSPRRVRVLDQRSYIAKKLRVDVSHSHSGHPVRFDLIAGGLAVSDAVLTYQVPGLPGWATASMRPAGRGRWRVEVPSWHAHAGWWNYRIDAVVEGISFHLPQHHWYSFELHAPPTDKAHGH